MIDRQIKDTAIKAIRYITGIGIIFLLWHIAATLANHGRGVYFPTPLSTLSGLIDLLKGEQIYGAGIVDHTAVSLLRWFKGFALASLIGVVLGIAMGYYQFLFDLFIPVVTFLQIIPGLAWVPVALLLFGLGEGATFFMIFITSLPPVIVNTAGGIRETPPVYMRASRMMGLKGPRTFFRILIPASSLSIINGLRIALASGWRVLIAAEMVVGSAQGLGFVIIQSRWSLDFVSAFSVIIIIAAIGLFIEKVLFQIIEDNLRHKMGFERIL
ncbi:ABC transporter permease [Spirochaeta isovalerica]|uniref:ABC-type nitrate/sulfonate/bicarbonate transport system permease component n=1 Tax=Spirochaeta isovalerica TaxID=150 RepID=A0A841RE34_9SPIO|nr:ABC transporter permease [Spirochaeta isovalerica]MBB6481260.1 ABC-type nitrate/sulfonate/bicarbonate transport system permease component [Spirochaeta isovalerica]